MGNKYIFEFCDRCKKETYHRIFKRYGKSDKGKSQGKKGIRRIVIWCLGCQKRKIENQRKQRRRKSINLIS